MPQAEEGISRVSRSKDAARVHYDRLSRGYDVLAGFWERAFREFGLRKLGVRESDIVLEIGFGTGRGLVSLGSSRRSSQIFGVDISHGMCRQARKKIQKAGLSERVRLVRGDGARLPFKNDRFDVVFVCFTLELFDTPEIPDVLSECARVLREGKRLCVVALSKKRMSGWVGRVYEWAHRIFPRSLDCRPIFVQEAVQKAGFHILDITLKKNLGLPVEIVVARKGAL
jgi:demethylmenaquinone methyltransferase/2-methoxy-6-polyprenyl-1,4-benzoquinol methylase